MRILFLTQYFPPETGAAQNRLSDLANRLAAAGHDITVLTALPSYPRGEIFSGYRGRWTMKENQGDLEVVRTWAFATKRKGFVVRMLNYLSFSILALVLGSLSLKRADVVFVESPPLFVGLSGFWFAKVMQAKFVLNISDLWPESAVALGMLRNRSLISWATRLEEYLYRHASFVTCQTMGIVDSIRQRCPRTRLALLTNGVSPEFLTTMETARQNREAIRRDFNFTGKFIVAYTGVHGLSQGLETILDAAQRLTRYEGIQFCFWGDGPEKPRLQSITAEKKLGNVALLPTESASRMAEVLAAIDVSIVPLRRTDLFKGALPSKLFEAMGAGIPVVVGIEGEARQLIQSSAAGIAVEPENGEQMADAILKLFADPELRQKLGQNGSRYVAKHYNRNEIAARLQRILVDVTKEDSSAANDTDVSLNYDLDQL